jgi:hypothetical protein
MATKKIGPININISSGSNGTDGAVSVTFGIDELGVTGGETVALSGAEVDALVVSARAAIVAKLSEGGHTVEDA